MASLKFLQHRARIINEHRRIIHEMRAIEHVISERLKLKDPSWRELEKKRNALYLQIEPLIQEYWNILPAVELSRCPFCDERLLRVFDTVDLNGFWWMDRTQRTSNEPPSCAHFCLLTGAVNLNGRLVSGGLFECLPGPDVPYVIPRVLEFPTMNAVLSGIPMDCGYTAYSVTYFAEKPPAPKTLTHAWARKVFQFKDEGGKAGWDIKDETYDYELAPWIKSGKLLWYADRRLNEAAKDPKRCPFLDIPGKKRPQIVVDDQLRFQ
jgi:hypothetical protein